MPLPTENTNWPPEPYNDAQNAMAVWAAWYDGDENKLTELYTQERHVRPAQWRGGLVVGPAVLRTTQVRVPRPGGW